MTEHGYEATSTDDIARAAGVSPRTFFNYFPTKESVVVLPDDLLAGVVTEVLRSRPVSRQPGEEREQASVVLRIHGVERIGIPDPKAAHEFAFSVAVQFRSLTRSAGKRDSRHGFGVRAL